MHVEHSFDFVVTSAFLTTYAGEDHGGIITGLAHTGYLGRTGFPSWYAHYAGVLAGD